MKQLLFVYDRMMTGGTTTALLSLLKTIDYDKYTVDLLLYRNCGDFFHEIPPQVNLLDEAYVKGTGLLKDRYRKLVVSVFNGGLIRAYLARKKYKGTRKGLFKMILFHFFADSQVFISRKMKKHYDAAIGFIEGWSDHYVLSGKVKADKKIVWVHPDYEASYLIPEADRKAFKKADSIIVVASKCKETMEKIFPEFKDKIKVIENINSTDYLISRANSEDAQIKKHSIDFCTVSRCDMRVKGLDRIVNALSRLKKEGILKDCHWHQIGDGGDTKALIKRIKEADVEDNVTLYGHKGNPLVYLKQTDCFVLASRYEGKPVSVDEALGLGIPCVVTAYASAYDQVADGVNGLVVENSEEGVYFALKKVIQNPLLLDKFRQELIKNKHDNSCEINKLYELWS